MKNYITALLSQISYYNLSNINDLNLPEYDIPQDEKDFIINNFDLINPVIGTNYEQNGFNAMTFVAKQNIIVNNNIVIEQGEAIISYRGTEFGASFAAVLDLYADFNLSGISEVFGLLRGSKSAIETIKDIINESFKSAAESISEPNPLPNDNSGVNGYAKEYLENFKINNPELLKITLTGHSLGGFLAAVTAMENSSLISNAITFNAAGLSFVKVITDKLTNLIHDELNSLYVESLLEPEKSDYIEKLNIMKNSVLYDISKISGIYSSTGPEIVSSDILLLHPENRYEVVTPDGGALDLHGIDSLKKTLMLYEIMDNLMGGNINNYSAISNIIKINSLFDNDGILQTQRQLNLFFEINSNIYLTSDNFFSLIGLKLNENYKLNGYSLKTYNEISNINNRNELYSVLNLIPFTINGIDLNNTDEIKYNISEYSQKFLDERYNFYKKINDYNQVVKNISGIESEHLSSAIYYKVIITDYGIFNQKELTIDAVNKVIYANDLSFLNTDSGTMKAIDDVLDGLINATTNYFMGSSTYLNVKTKTINIFDTFNSDEIVIYGSETSIYLTKGNDKITVQHSFGARIKDINIVDGGIGDTITFIGGIENDQIIGTKYNDIINGYNGDDILIGGLGNDVINGGDGNDIINNTTSLLTYNNNGGGDIINGGTGTNILYGTGNGDTYIYSGGTDTIFEKNTNFGLGFNDILNLGYYANNGLSFWRNNFELVINLAGLDKIFIVDYFYHYEYLDEIHYYDNFNNTIILTTNDILNRIPVQDVNTIYGTENNDSIVGNSNNNTIYGGYGDDNIKGGAGNDYIFGNEGNDSLYGEAGNDIIYGGTGNDYIDGGIGNDVLYGNEGNDTIVGGSTIATEIDTIYGEDGDDIINIGQSYTGDIIYGGKNNDTIYNARGNDTFYYARGDGNDTIISTDTTSTYIDTLNLIDIDPNEIILVREGINNLDLIVKIGNENIIFKNYYSNINTLNYLDKIIFKDGTIWDKAIISKLAENYENTNLTTLSFGNTTLNYNIKTNSTDSLSVSTIITTSYNHVVLGGYGIDSINTGSGQDYITGGKGNDTLSGGSGLDNYFYTYGDGNDRIFESQDNNRLYINGTSQIDLFREGSSLYNLVILFNDGSKIDIHNYYNTANDYKKIFEIIFDDGESITSTEMLEKAKRYYNNTKLTTLNFTNSLSHIINTLSDGITVTTTTSIGDDEINGGDGIDIINAGAGNDIINGGGGNDIIGQSESSILSNDIIIGGRGDDKIYTYQGNNEIIYNLGDGNDIIYIGSDAGNRIIRFGENITKDDLKLYSASNGNDIIIELADGSKISLINSLINLIKFESISIIFNNGDQMNSSEIKEEIRIIKGDNNKNTIVDTIFDDEIYGYSGDDTITLSTSRPSNNNTVYGGDGNDTITGNNYNDTIYGGNGSDTIRSRIGVDIIYGEEGNDSIYAEDTINNMDRDFIYGGDGNDTINQYVSYTGDNIYGGKGNDTIYVAHGTNNLYFESGDGDDTVYITKYEDSINNIYMNNISINDLKFTFSTETLVITNIITNDKINIKNYFSNYTIISNLILIDKTFNTNELFEYIRTINGSNGDDVINWDSRFSDIIKAGKGNDTITLGNTYISEADTIIYESGDGIDTFISTSENKKDIIKLIGLNKSDVKMYLKTDGSGDFVIEENSSNKIILKNYANSQNSLNKIEKIIFNDLSEISGEELRLYYNKIQAEHIEGDNREYWTYTNGVYWESEITGTDKNDYINTTQFSTNQIIMAGDGDDYIITKSATIYSGNGNDTITSNNFSTIYSGDGDDIITAKGGSIIHGGKGNDIIIPFSNSSINIILNNETENIHTGGYVNFQTNNININEITISNYSYEYGTSINYEYGLITSTYDRINNFKFNNINIYDLFLNGIIKIKGDDLNNIIDLNGLKTNLLTTYNTLTNMGFNISTGDGNDRVKSSSGYDIIDLGNGNDIVSIISDNTIYGGNGNDTYLFGSDTVSGYRLNISTGYTTVHDSSGYDIIKYGLGEYSFGNQMKYEKVGNDLAIYVQRNGITFNTTIIKEQYNGMGIDEINVSAFGYITTTNKKLSGINFNNWLDLLAQYQDESDIDIKNDIQKNMSSLWETKIT